MVAHNTHKSISINGVAQRPPVHALVGLLLMLGFEALLFTDNTFVGMYFTPLQWTGLILLLDGLQKWRKGASLLMDHFREFALLCVISIGSWLVFELYNVALKNWCYFGLPENMWLRYAGYAWAFATISPGMFLIHQTIDDLLPAGGGRRRAHLVPPESDESERPRLPDPVFYGFIAFGLVCLVAPIAWPSTYMTPLVWMGFAFFLDPINGRMGERSILSEFFTGRFRSMPVFFLSGLVAGIVWEFWNFWADTKWEYAVPYLGHIKVFEMPVLGFLGFMPFIIESFAIYTFVRHWVPIRRKVVYLG